MPSFAKSVILVIPNELIVPKLFLYALLGKDLVLLPAHPILPWCRSLVDRVVSWLLSKGYASSAADLFAEVRELVDGVGPEYQFDVFARIEPWMESRLCFGAAEQKYGRYALAYKSAACSFLRTCLAGPVLLRAVLDADSSRHFRIVGASREVLEIYEQLFGVSCNAAPSPGRVGTLAVNAAQLIAVLGITFGYVLRACLRSEAGGEEMWLGADFIADPRDLPVYEAFGGPKNTVLLARNKSYLSGHEHLIAGYRMVTFDDGIFSLREVAPTLVEFVRDAFRIFFAGAFLAPFLLWLTLDSARKRVSYRGLFNRYYFRNFWGRDDYNPDHIIRTQELRRRGHRSLGLNHGLPILATVIPHFRYIDFDVYFTFGEHIYARYYSSTWPASVKVVASGAFSMVAEPSRKAVKTSMDIGIFLKIGYWPQNEDERLVGFVNKIANAFPDRRIIVKFKSMRWAPQEISDAIEIWRSIPNITIAEHGKAYEVLEQVGFCISDPSTVAAEAISYGAVSFVIDFPSWRSLIFRDFPAMMVQSAEETILRICRLEAGQEIYPWAQFDTLIGLPGIPFPDLVMREALP
jgi:hypothetical protein